MTHKFHSSILRAYDIRGIYDETLFDKDAYFVGRSFGSILRKNGKKKIAVACDGRLSSPALKTELVRGLVESGVDVFDVLVGPTPMLYFAIYHLDCDAGVMVTGSHNPKNHNGFKMALKEKPFFGDDILGLQKIIDDEDLVEDEGSLNKIDIVDKYVAKISADCVLGCSKSELLDEIDKVDEHDKKIKIAWDNGNGAAGEVLKKLTKKINAKNILLFDEIDGSFPNHHPDPTVEANLEDLKNVILKEKCDIGIAFDGDGDRIGVMDDEGEILWGDQLLIFFAREILQKNQGATIIADVKASAILFDEIAKSGGKPLMYKTGHSFVKSKMKEVNSPLAGEMSGHIFFADEYLGEKNHGYDDALYAAVRIINILVKSGKKLSELRKELPQVFSTPEIRIEVKDEEKFAIIESLQKSLEKDGVKFNNIDGVRADVQGGWWLIRASNTQAVLVARCEANSLEKLADLKKLLRQKLQLCGVRIPDELK